MTLKLLFSLFLLSICKLMVYSVRKKYEVENAKVTIMVGSNPNLPLTAQIETEAQII